MEIEISPISKLLSMLPKLLLDNYVLEVITDPGLLVKLLLAKLGNDNMMILPIKAIRNARNKNVHKVSTTQGDYICYQRAAISIKDWLLSDQFNHCDKTDIQLCVGYCDEIIIKFEFIIIKDEPTKQGKEVSLRNSNEIISGLTYKGKLLDIKLSDVYRETIKGKIIKILSGNNRDKEGIFKAWNGTKALINIDNKIVSVSMGTRIEFTA